MSKFILFIIILNFIVVIYNLRMWYKVGTENEILKKENHDLRYERNLYYIKYRRNVRIDKNV